MDHKPQGCLSGLLQLFVLDQIFDWLQAQFGFGRGCSCSGCGCGVLLLILGLIFSCAILTGTNWFQFSF